MLIIFIIVLIVLALMILDVNLLDIIEPPKSKLLFKIFLSLAIIFLIISLIPGIIVDQPNGIYRGNLKAHNLMTEYEKDKTYVSALSFTLFVILVSLSPYWYRYNEDISKGELLKFIFTILVIGGVYMLSFNPELIVGQRPWVEPRTNDDTMLANYSKWIKSRNNLKQIWIIITAVIVQKRVKISKKIDRIYNIIVN